MVPEITSTMSSESKGSSDDVEVISIGELPLAMHNTALTRPEINRGSGLVGCDSYSLRGTNSLQLAGHILEAQVTPDMDSRRRSNSAGPRVTIPSTSWCLPGSTEAGRSPPPLPVEYRSVQ